MTNSIDENSEKPSVKDKMPGNRKPTINILSIKKAKIIANIDHPNNR